MMSTVSQASSDACLRHRRRSRSVLCSGLALLAACATHPPKPAESAGTEVEARAITLEPIRQDLEFKLEAGQPVHIDNPYGGVFLRFGGYEHELGLHTTLQQPAQAPVIRLEPRSIDGRFEIAPRLPEGDALAAGQRFDLVAYIPQRHAVTVRTLAGSIESRGVQSDIALRSDSGDLAVRGNEGLVQAETGAGSIEAAFAGVAIAGSRQRLATTTGTIIVGVTDALAAEVRLATSAPFTTDYSLDVVHHAGAEPNKSAQARIGKVDAAAPAVLELHSLRGDIRLLRRAVYIDVPVAPPAP
ncbi:MAG: hypothetical protein IT478_12900, partial [Xanthomonadales bacterium]|nr:hypothetical protein [Xanthomonadales bacterium]